MCIIILVLFEFKNHQNPNVGLIIEYLHTKFRLS